MRRQLEFCGVFFSFFNTPENLNPETVKIVAIKQAQKMAKKKWRKSEGKRGKVGG